MPLFSDLRSDYPLNLTVLERPYARVLQQSYRASLPSARAITVLPAGSNQMLVSFAGPSSIVAPGKVSVLSLRHLQNCLITSTSKLVHLVEHYAQPARQQWTLCLYVEALLSFA